MNFLQANKRKIQITLRLVVSAAAIGFLIYGCMRGEMAVVLGKATTVCMQCIGLG